MSKDAVLRLRETVLFKALINKEKYDYNSAKLSSKVVDIVNYVSPLLSRVSENMEEFTLHDPNHSAKVVELMGLIIPKETLENLNSIEITLLIISGYLHDIGMTCSKDEKEEIINSSDEFKVLFKSNIEKYSRYIELK